MNPEIKALWVAALQSGKYRKGRSALKEARYQDTRFCCLGVLCDLHRKAVKKTRWYKTALGELSYQGATAALPPAVMAWAGLSSDNPLVNGVSLIYLNDGKDAPFTDIANEIEKYL